MKLFIFKTFIFIISPILLYLAIVTLMKIKFSNDIDNYHAIILGDSQTEFIRFPEIYNRSIHGSPYYVHYEFAKEFIDQIKGKKIYIACNYHNLSKLYQNRLVNDSLMPGWRNNTFQTLNSYNLFNKKYNNILPKDLSYNFFDIKVKLRLLKDSYLSKTSKNSMNSVVNDTLSIKEDIKRHWNEPKYVLNDFIQRKYLKKLILLLKENNCDIVLLKMPLTSYYTSKVPLKIKKEFKQISYNYKIQLLDLNEDFKISSDYNYFKDYGHLNLKGDSLVTEYFKKNEIETIVNKKEKHKINDTL